MNPINTTICVLFGIITACAVISIRNGNKLNRVADEATEYAEKIADLKAKMAAA